jgi:hypothetical protein
MSDFILALPITVSVYVTGGVAVEGGTRVVTMSRFSERAQRLAAEFGDGIHVLDAAAMRGLDAPTYADITDALDI